MNLRVLPSLAHSCQTLDAISISVRPSATVSSREPPYSIQYRIVLFGGNCVSSSLLGHQLDRSLGRINLWKQVQKEKVPVDFTIPSAEIQFVWLCVAPTPPSPS
jgi:hypothetical protein